MIFEGIIDIIPAVVTKTVESDPTKKLFNTLEKLKLLNLLRSNPVLYKCVLAQ